MMFRNTKPSILVKAANSIPYVFTNKKFKVTVMIEVETVIFLNVLCFPVIDRIFATGPVDAFIN